MSSKLTKIVFAAITLGLFGFSADAVFAQNRQGYRNEQRETRREYRRDVREARRDYRDDIRDGDNRAAARREYRNEVREARREYRQETRNNRGEYNLRNRPRGRAYGYYTRRPYVGVRNNRRYYSQPRRGIDYLPRRNRY